MNKIDYFVRKIINSGAVDDFKPSLFIPYPAHIYFHDITEEPYLPIFYKKKCLAISHIHPVLLDVIVSRIH